MSTVPVHKPVMPAETLAALGVKPDGVYVDATAGLGGHSAQIAARLSDKGRLYAFEVDPQAAEIWRSAMAGFGGRAELVCDSYVNAAARLAERGAAKVDGALFDFGVSSLQLDSASRGFSIMAEGHLDMRFSPATSLTADEMVNTWPAEELARVFWEYGEERFSRRAAMAITAARQRAPIRTTAQLREVVERAVPRMRHSRVHPATRIFQALRICVNAELDTVRKGLEGMAAITAPEGVLCAISFHSLEDRIVKRFFLELQAGGGWQLLFRKPQLPTEEEMAANPRSRSAKLRAIRKTDAPQPSKNKFRQ